jgi:hypothetical protein
MLTFLQSASYCKSLAVHVSCTGLIRNAYKILVRKPERRRPPGRPRHRWEVNIKMDLKEVGYKEVDWIHLDQDRGHWWALVNMAVHFQVPRQGIS